MSIEGYSFAVKQKDMQECKVLTECYAVFSPFASIRIDSIMKLTLCFYQIRSTMMFATRVIV